MSGKISISRYGLTRCPGCSAHVRVEREKDEAQCPFCQHTVLFHGEQRSASSVGKPLSRAILMASILGLPFAACSDSSPAKDTATADIVDAVTDMSDVPAVEDVIAQPPYGIPMDWTEPSEDLEDGGPTDAMQPLDVLDQPAYGVPMDWVEPAPDVQEDAAQDAAPPEDALPQPPYGIPMDWSDEDAN